jgi:hypothetical protein
MKKFSSRTLVSPVPGVRSASTRGSRGTGEVGPGHRPENGLQKRDAAHPAGGARRPVEGERAAPIVSDQHDAIEPERVEPGIEIAGVIAEFVGDVRLARPPHADEIGGKTAAGAKMGQHFPPEIRGRRVAVQEDKRCSAALFLIEHCGVEHVDYGHCSFPRSRSIW